MFVTNCHVNKTEKLRDPTAEEGEYYYPVQCELCKLEVAILDQDEIYHFFEVIAS